MNSDKPEHNNVADRYPEIVKMLKSAYLLWDAEMVSPSWPGVMEFKFDIDKDIIAAHWLTAEEILAPDFKARSPIVGKVLRDYLAGQRYPLSLIYHHE